MGVGVLLVRGLRGDRTRAASIGLAIAGRIAGYTLIDNTGITLADQLAYLEAVMVGPALVLPRRRGNSAGRAGAPGAASDRKRSRIAPSRRYAPSCSRMRLRLAPAAPVAAVRETSVLIVTGLAAAVLKERVGPARAAGAALVVAGDRAPRRLDN